MRPEHRRRYDRMMGNRHHMHHHHCGPSIHVSGPAALILMLIVIGIVIFNLILGLVMA